MCFIIFGENIHSWNDFDDNSSDFAPLYLSFTCSLNIAKPNRAFGIYFDPNWSAVMSQSLGFE